MPAISFPSSAFCWQYAGRERAVAQYLLSGVAARTPALLLSAWQRATHLEAVTPFISKAIEKSFMPCIANMAVMGIVSLPGTMIGQILGGSNPDVAVKYQIMIIVITFCASMLSLVITLWLARKLSFDDYGRLRDIMRKK
jgi:ABC-type iron transport system FetAB permease component